MDTKHTQDLHALKKNIEQGMAELEMKIRTGEREGLRLLAQKIAGAEKEHEAAHFHQSKKGTKTLPLSAGKTLFNQALIEIVELRGKTPEESRAELYIDMLNGIMDAEAWYLLTPDINKDDNLDGILDFPISQFNVDTIKRISDIVLQSKKPVPWSKENVYGRRGSRPLHTAIATENTTVIDHIIDVMKTYVPSYEISETVETNIVWRGIQFAKEGKTHMVEYLDSLPGKLNWGNGAYRNRFGDMLVAASGENHWETADWLLEQGADPKTSKNASLRNAIKNGNLDAVKKLFPLSSESKNYLAIIDAVIHGQDEIRDWLMPFTDWDALNSKIPRRQTKACAIAAQLISDKFKEKHLGMAEPKTRKGL